MMSASTQAARRGHPPPGRAAWQSPPGGHRRHVTELEVADNTDNTSINDADGVTDVSTRPSDSPVLRTCSASAPRPGRGPPGRGARPSDSRGGRSPTPTSRPGRPVRVGLVRRTSTTPRAQEGESEGRGKPIYPVNVLTSPGLFLWHISLWRQWGGPFLVEFCRHRKSFPAGQGRSVPSSTGLAGSVRDKDPLQRMEQAC